MLPTLYKKSSLCWHYFRLAFIVFLCFFIQFCLTFGTFLVLFASFLVPFGALGLSFGTPGPSFDALGPQVRKMTPRERIGREFGVQIGPHFEPNFRFVRKKIGVRLSFSTSTFLSRFFMVFWSPRGTQKR